MVEMKHMRVLVTSLCILYSLMPAKAELLRLPSGEFVTWTPDIQVCRATLIRSEKDAYNSQFKVRKGEHALGGQGVSYESDLWPGYFLCTERNNRLFVRRNDGTKEFAARATFVLTHGTDSSETALRLLNTENQVRYDGGLFRVAPGDGTIFERWSLERTLKSVKGTQWVQQSL